MPWTVKRGKLCDGVGQTVSAEKAASTINEQCAGIERLQGQRDVAWCALADVAKEALDFLLRPEYMAEFVEFNTVLSQKAAEAKEGE